jgi:hypothetical protein
MTLEFWFVVSGLLGSCNEQERTCGQHIRVRTHDCTYAYATHGTCWVCGLYKYVMIGLGCILIQQGWNVAYTFWQLCVRRSTVLLMIWC